MLFNKIAGAVLVTALAAMIISKIGDALIPEHHLAAHQGEDTTTPTNGTTTTPSKDPPFNTAIAEADVKYGERQAKKCTSCHTLKKGGRNSQGPNLWGVVGRARASVEGFSYSSAMKEKGGTWDYESLYVYLKNPQSVVKGTKMSYRMSSAKQRGAVIAYLRTLHDSPPPLPKVEPASKPEPEKPMPAPEQAPGKTAPEKQPEPKKSALPKGDEPAAPAPKQDEPGKPEMKPETKKAEPKPDMSKPDAPKADAPKAMPPDSEPKKTEPAPAEPKPEGDKKSE